MLPALQRRETRVRVDAFVSLEIAVNLCFLCTPGPCVGLVELSATVNVDRSLFGIVHFAKVSS